MVKLELALINATFSFGALVLTYGFNKKIYCLKKDDKFLKGVRVT